MQFPEIKLGRYRHYKGKEYEVLGIVIHSESLEPHVLYRAMYFSEEFGEHATFVRPYSMFVEDIEFEGKTGPRFEYLWN